MRKTLLIKSKKTIPNDIESRQMLDTKAFKKILKCCRRAEGLLVKAQTRANYVSRFDHNELDLITKLGVDNVQKLIFQLKARFEDKVLGAYKDWNKRGK